MKKLFAFLSSILVCIASFAINDTVIDIVADQDMAIEAPEKLPEFKGGQEALYKWLGEHVVYPEKAAAEGIEGRVTVSFVVKKDGSISDVKVVKGVHPLLDAEAVRVISSMPKWNPGMNKGQAVNVFYNLPISFKLPEEAPQEDFSNLTIIDLRNMMIEALNYDLANGEISGMKIANGEVINEYVAVKFNFDLVELPEWWGQFIPDHYGIELALAYYFPYGFRKECLEHGLPLRGTVKGPGLSPIEYEISGENWLPEDIPNTVIDIVPDDEMK